MHLYHKQWQLLNQQQAVSKAGHDTDQQNEMVITRVLLDLLAIVEQMHAKDDALPEPDKTVSNNQQQQSGQARSCHLKCFTFQHEVQQCILKPNLYYTTPSHLNRPLADSLNKYPPSFSVPSLLFFLPPFLPSSDTCIHWQMNCSTVFHSILLSYCTALAPNITYIHSAGDSFGGSRSKQQQ